jgi:hypothetical protein
MPKLLKTDAGAALSLEGAAVDDPSGEVALQLIYALFSALKGFDAGLDERLRVALDNCVELAEQTGTGDQASGYSRISGAILSAFRAGLTEERLQSDPVPDGA